MSQKTQSVKFGKVERQSFGKIKKTVDIPYLIELQKSSYESFLRFGIDEVLQDFSPIVSHNNKFELDFFDVRIEDKCKYSVKECKEREVTYTYSLRVKVRLTNRETGEISESEIFLGDYPKMTDSGTFIINGAERVVVSQLIRSPGVYNGKGVKDKFGILRFDTQVMPTRGAWLEFLQEALNTVSVRVDRKKKINVTLLLKALGLDSKQIAKIFGFDSLIMNTLEKDGDNITQAKAKRETYIKLKPGENPLDANVEPYLNNLFFERRRYDLTRVGRYMFNKQLSLARRLEGLTLAKDVIKDGEILAVAGTTLSLAKGWEIQNAGVNSVFVKLSAKEKDVPVNASCYIEELGVNIQNKEVGIFEKVYRPFVSEIIKPFEAEMEDGKLPEPKRKKLIKAIKDAAEEITIPEEYTKIVGNNVVDLSTYIDVDPKELGVYEHVYYPALKKLIDASEGDMQKLKDEIKENIDTLVVRHLTIDDIISALNINLQMRFKYEPACPGGYPIQWNPDNIDHLSNRRVKAVGELLKKNFEEGMGRLEKIVKERMISQKAEEITPSSLVTVKPVTACIKEFFGTSQLSQFLDQPNPIAELTHKRKLSALGPGGLSRERAGLEVRDVHHSHYGRMCPIETPEGQNIGLITSLSTYARVNEYGFIETPYRKVNKKTGVVTDTVEYLAADVEDRYVVAQANEPLDEKQKFVHKRVLCRYQDKIREFNSSEVDYMDVSPQQLVSVATSLIPFLENDDAQRALMGSNMQRQAVPLITPEAPMIATGLEHKVALDSGVCLIAKSDGVVTRVSADYVDIKDSDEVVTYKLQKFYRSNQDTCINQKPIVSLGQKVKKGEIIADGPSIENGELALGRNILVGFMPWEGYNFEDAILISEELIREDVFTSIHIEKYETDVRTTKLGDEVFTNDIPNVSPELLRFLDEDGIVMVGAEVKAGDYLVGKIAPKAQSEISPDQRLINQIFGDKSMDIRDVSLKVPNGEGGTVVDVKIFTKENKDELPPSVLKLVRVYVAQKRKIGVGDKMAGRHGNKGVISRVLPKEDMPFLEDGTSLQIVLNPLGVPSRMNIGQVLEVHLGYACKALGIKIATPVFDGASEIDIRDVLEKNKLYANDKSTGKSHIDGKYTLYDGRTGEQFHNRVTVGYMYMLKLIHLVDDKMHARSTGPYSLVTQQPLGGKAQMGGQRFGEMEVWALEAYGAAHLLQEILTVKSDDVNGRNKTYDSLAKGNIVPVPGIPESFRVLQRELQSLAIDVKLLTEGAEEVKFPSLSIEDQDIDPLSFSTESAESEVEVAEYDDIYDDLMQTAGLSTTVEEEGFDDPLDLDEDDDLDLSIFGDKSLEDFLAGGDSFDSFFDNLGDSSTKKSTPLDNEGLLLDEFNVEEFNNLDDIKDIEIPTILSGEKIDSLLEDEDKSFSIEDILLESDDVDDDFDFLLDGDLLVDNDSEFSLNEDFLVGDDGLFVPKGDKPSTDSPSPSKEEFLIDDDVSSTEEDNLTVDASSTEKNNLTDDVSSPEEDNLADDVSSIREDNSIDDNIENEDNNQKKED